MIDFRELTKEVIAAEKQGFWSDWTEDQRQLYTQGDWKAFSRSRGYTEHEIERCELWLNIIEENKQKGINILESVADLVKDAALKNFKLDKNCEIMKSSHFPGINNATMEDIENKIKSMPEALSTHDLPVKHSFTDTQYIRESMVPKGMIFTTGIHKTEHPMFIIKGDVTIFTNDGVSRVKAPWYGITKPGTKRIIYTHEDSTCVTVHTTKETDIDNLEKELIALSFKEYNEHLLSKEEKCLL